MRHTLAATLIFLRALPCLAEESKNVGAEVWGELSSVLTGAAVWETDAQPIADMLGMHAEMEDGRVRRHIVYPEQRWKGRDFQSLGRTPRAIQMTSDIETGKPRKIRIIFGNRGDDLWDIYKGNKPEDRPDSIADAKTEYRKEIREAVEGIDADAKALGATLTEMFGTPSLGRARRDIDTGEKREWWQADGFRVELSHSKGMMTFLDITPDSDQPGDSVRRRGTSLGEVRSQPNGDVFIDGVPEVHQGDKPYCSAASLERLFRLLSVNVDQYELGVAVGSGDSQIGSGWRKLIDIGRKLALRHRLAIGEVDAGRGLSRVSKLIDSGTPLMWAQRSSPQLTALLQELSSKRSELGKPSRKRSKVFAEEAKNALGHNPGTHACLVVGYNQDTEEVAISNTWQGKSDLMWIPLEVFETSDWGAKLVYLKDR
ncbi:MAG: hypothetical protein WEC73_05265 [Chthoniobacterales bacterium]